MFINYFGNPVRSSRLNIVVARFLVGFYVIWKTIWYNWELFLQAPVSLAAAVYTALIPSSFPMLLTIEKWVLILAMVLFIFGYRLRLTSFVGATILAHFAAIRFTLNPGGGTTALFIGVWFIIFFGLYNEQRGFGVDTIRLELNTLSRVNEFLKSESSPVRMDPLRWSLLSIAVVYFGAGIQKTIQGPLFQWTTAENLRRTIVMMNAEVEVMGGLGPTLAHYPQLMFLGAWGTIVIELGFLFVVLSGVSITLFILGIFLMQLLIGLMMGPFFFDIYPLFMAFFAWDWLLKAMSADSEIDVVYDEHCYFCARSLLPFKILDVQDSITFYSQYDAPEQYHNHASVDFGSAMYIFDGGEAYQGYFAFRKLLDQFGIFSPVVWLMGTRPAAAIGQRTYSFFAKHRNRYFTCSVD